LKGEKMRDECEHGNLGRSCEICELKAALAEREKEIATLEAEKNLLYDDGIEKGKRIIALEATVKEKDGIVREVEEEAQKVRLVLLLNHGHEGAYLDDGEMQCGACNFGDYDFKKPSLSELTKRIVFGLNEQIAALEAEVREKDKKCELYLRTNKGHLNTMLVQSKQIAALTAERDELQIFRGGIIGLLASYGKVLDTPENLIQQMYDEIGSLTASEQRLRAECDTCYVRKERNELRETLKNCHCRENKMASGIDIENMQILGVTTDALKEATDE
jgi:hypothetical protein